MTGPSNINHVIANGHQPIMLKNLLIMLFSSAQNGYLLCSIRTMSVITAIMQQFMITCDWSWKNQSYLDVKFEMILRV